MAMRRTRPAHGHTHRRSGLRLGLLLGAAVLGGVGVSPISPAANLHTITAHTATETATRLERERTQEEAASRGETRDPLSTDSEQSPGAASAIPQAQARAHTLAAIAARRTAAPAPDAHAVPAAGPDAYRAYARTKAGAAQFSCLNKLWNRESGWRPTAQNPSSTAYGIAQLLDSTWAYTGIAKTPDGYRQVDAGLTYIRAAYGTPCTAWAHETTDGWY